MTFQVDDLVVYKKHHYQDLWRVVGVRDEWIWILAVDKTQPDRELDEPKFRTTHADVLEKYEPFFVKGCVYDHRIYPAYTFLVHSVHEESDGKPVAFGRVLCELPDTEVSHTWKVLYRPDFPEYKQRYPKA